MNNIIPTLKYVRITLIHKWWVFIAGLKTNASVFRLLIHDWTKFTPWEAPYYGRQYFGDKLDPEGFQEAWLHHLNNNKHHWESWALTTAHNKDPKYSDGDCLLMRDLYVREMAADWLGASRAYEGKWPTDFESWEWFQKDAESRVQLHPDSRARLMEILQKVFDNSKSEY